VNKVSSKVELRFDLPGTRCLDDAVKERLRALAASRLDASGWILVTSQRTRDQPKNLDDARAKLAALVVKALVVPTPRKATKPSRGVKERRLRDKAHDSAKKRERTLTRDD
jgi:ribosome-associated protein